MAQYDSFYDDQIQAPQPSPYNINAATNASAGFTGFSVPANIYNPTATTAVDYKPRPPPPSSSSSSHSAVDAESKSNEAATRTTKKVKLKMGSLVEVYSNSQQQWIDGKVVKIKGQLLCIAYGAPIETQKWLQATSKDFRPKLNDDDADLSTPLQTAKPSANNAADYDAMNNPTANRFRKSVAFQQSKPLRVKLKVNSMVEVFSVSKNRWEDGKITGIKKKLIRVAYGAGLNTEKWLQSTSKQFRPKLDMVDNAVSGSNVGTHNYEVHTDDVHTDHTGDDVDDAKDNGNYVTHSLRREQYEAHSADTIKGATTKRGDLKIKVHGALQLKKSANFAAITVADHTLRTKKVKTDENPVWKEILTFSNFRPRLGKTGIINVTQKHAIRGERVVGSAEFELPIVFDKQEKMTIDLANAKSKLSGIVVLEQTIVSTK